MKLYFKQRVFSFKQRTDIFDEFGNVIFVAEGEIFSLGRRMHIYDMNRCQNYRVEGLGWHIDGDIFAHDYRITCGGKYIASIHKHWMTWGDSFEIDIAYEQDTVMALGVIIAIDCVIDQSQN